MKRYAILCILCLLAVSGAQQTRSGNPIQFTHEVTPQVSWVDLDSDGITSSQAIPGVADRDYTTVAALAAAKTITWTVPADVSGVQFRFVGDTNNNSDTVSMLIAAGQYQYDGTTVDDFMLGATFALTTGQQVGPGTGELYVDTITVTNGVLTMTAYDSGNDRVCLVKGDLEGYTKIVFVASTLNSTTIKIQARWW